MKQTAFPGAKLHPLFYCADKHHLETLPNGIEANEKTASSLELAVTGGVILSQSAYLGTTAGGGLLLGGG